MTEEEKKAIEYLIEEIKSLEKVKIEFSNEIEDKGWLLKNINELDKDLFYINTLLNLIKKLQKENEELRHSYDIATTKTEELKKKLGLKQFDVNVVYNDYLEKLREFKSNSVPKDKIREKLEDYKNEIECEKSYIEQGIISEEDYKKRVKVYNSYISILNKLLMGE